MSEDTTQVPEEVRDSPHFANLRREKEALEADLAAERTKTAGLRGQLIRNAVELAGFKPNEQGDFDGMTSLVVEKFQQGLADDALPTKDGFIALAGQYGLTVGSTDGEQQQTVVDQLAALQQQGNQLQNLGKPPAPPADIDTQIQEAIAAGDIARSVALENQKFDAALAIK